MDIIGMLKTLFGFGQATAEAVTARTPPKEIQIANAERKSDRLDGDEFARILKQTFHEVKTRPELDIPLYVSFKYENMEVSQRNELKDLVMQRVIQYRKDIVKMKGLKWKKHKAWLDKNNL